VPTTNPTETGSPPQSECTTAIGAGYGQEWNDDPGIKGPGKVALMDRIAMRKGGTSASRNKDYRED
jgi:hypothetical protein